MVIDLAELSTPTISSRRRTWTLTVACFGVLPAGAIGDRYGRRG